jgi:hypothetical protein
MLGKHVCSPLLEIQHAKAKITHSFLQRRVDAVRVRRVRKRLRVIGLSLPANVADVSSALQAAREREREHAPRLASFHNIAAASADLEPVFRVSVFNLVLRPPLVRVLDDVVKVVGVNERASVRDDSLRICQHASHPAAGYELVRVDHIFRANDADGLAARALGRCCFFAMNTRQRARSFFFGCAARAQSALVSARTLVKRAAHFLCLRTVNSKDKRHSKSDMERSRFFLEIETKEPTTGKTTDNGLGI